MSTHFTPQGPAILHGAESFVCHSASVGAPLEIRIASPRASPWATPPEALPLLIVLDGDLFFGTAVETTRLQSSLFGEIPAHLVVGIGYGTDDPVLQGSTRARDLTPTEAAIPTPGAVSPGPIVTGGADRFLAFLADELLPWLERTYPVASGQVTLSGSSLGGLFVIHALLERPSVFDRYLAVSPALWWDDAVLLRRAPERLAALDDLDADVFLAVGSLEEGAGIPGLDDFRMITHLEALAEHLRRPGLASLRVQLQIFEDDSHTSVVPVALSRGLRALAGPGVPT